MQKIGPSRAVLLAITVSLAVITPCASVQDANAAADDQVTAKMRDDYRTAVKSIDQLRVQNKYLQDLIASQESARSVVARQRDNYQRVKPEIVPLMAAMIDSLGKFVELDLPFQLESRRARVQSLADALASPENSDAEKLRQILEAYQVEINFGYDLDATVGWLEANGPRREVNFLRVGRLVLAYQTHDGAETGFFNPASRSWELLPDQYRSVVAEGLRIARKQAAPVLLRLPVAAPEPAQ